MSDPLSQRLLVAATGPVVTAALAFVVVNVLTARAQRRTEDWRIRSSLTSDLTEVANGLYLASQAYWRAARTTALAERSHSEALAGARERFDAAYQAARLRGQVLDAQLAMYYKTGLPAKEWHRVTDLLSVRYFLLWEGEPARRQAIRERNAGRNHSGLSEAELNKPGLLLLGYREALKATIEAVWNEDVAWKGTHLRRAGAPAASHSLGEIDTAGE